MDEFDDFDNVDGSPVPEQTPAFGAQQESSSQADEAGQQQHLKHADLSALSQIVAAAESNTQCNQSQVRINSFYNNASGDASPAESMAMESPRSKKKKKENETFEEREARKAKKKAKKQRKLDGLTPSARTDGAASSSAMGGGGSGANSAGMEVDDDADMQDADEYDPTAIPTAIASTESGMLQGFNVVQRPGAVNVGAGNTIGAHGEAIGIRNPASRKNSFSRGDKGLYSMFSPMTKAKVQQQPADVQQQIIAGQIPPGGVPGLNLNLNFLPKYQNDESGLTAITPHNTKSTTTKHINSEMQKLSIAQGQGAIGIHDSVGVNPYGAANAQHTMNYVALQGQTVQQTPGGSVQMVYNPHATPPGVVGQSSGAHVGSGPHTTLNKSVGNMAGMGGNVKGQSFMAASAAPTPVGGMMGGMNGMGMPQHPGQPPVHPMGLQQQQGGVPSPSGPGVPMLITMQTPYGVQQSTVLSVPHAVSPNGQVNVQAAASALAQAGVGALPMGTPMHRGTPAQPGSNTTGSLAPPHGHGQPSVMAPPAHAAKTSFDRLGRHVDAAAQGVMAPPRKGSYKQQQGGLTLENLTNGGGMPEGRTSGGSGGMTPGGGMNMSGGMTPGAGRAGDASARSNFSAASKKSNPETNPLHTAFQKHANDSTLQDDNPYA